MKELKLLFSESLKEVKNNPLEAIGTLGVFVAMLVTCWFMTIICYAIGG
tara:strand:- start:849 stop:995 length:147 start_codon:yes stop_codon:yes gene_type:complete